MLRGFIHVISVRIYDFGNENYGMIESNLSGLENSWLGIDIREMRVQILHNPCVITNFEL